MLWLSSLESRGKIVEYELDLLYKTYFLFIFDT